MNLIFTEGTLLGWRASSRHCNHSQFLPIDACAATASPGRVTTLDHEVLWKALWGYSS